LWKKIRTFKIDMDFDIQNHNFKKISQNLQSKEKYTKRPATTRHCKSSKLFTLIFAHSKKKYLQNFHEATRF